MKVVDMNMRTGTHLEGTVCKPVPIDPILISFGLSPVVLRRRAPKRLRQGSTCVQRRGNKKSDMTRWAVFMRSAVPGID